MVRTAMHTEQLCSLGFRVSGQTVRVCAAVCLTVSCLSLISASFQKLLLRSSLHQRIFSIVYGCKSAFLFTLLYIT